MDDKAAQRLVDGDGRAGEYGANGRKGEDIRGGAGTKEGKRRIKSRGILAGGED
jgi:hypothetical protein